MLHHNLETAKPALLFLTETQISPPADTSYLNYPGYKLEHKFLPRAGVCLFVRGDICCRRLALNQSEESVVWVCVKQGGLSPVYACVYNNRHGVYESNRFFEHIQCATDKVLERNPSAKLLVLGDFNGLAPVGHARYGTTGQQTGMGCENSSHRIRECSFASPQMIPTSVLRLLPMSYCREWIASFHHL